MAYQITIKKITTEKFLQKGSWVTLEKRPWTDEELSKASHEAYGKGFERLLKDQGILKEVQGYAPNFESFKDVETEVLKQTVEELNLSEVIKAINNLK